MNDRSIPVPNSFQLPNVIVDYWMSRLSDSQFKVLLAICRKTWGWHKEVDMVSNVQIQQLTGLSRSAVRRACQDLVVLKLIICKANKNKKGDNDPNTYGVLTRNVYAGESCECGKTKQWKKKKKEPSEQHKEEGGGCRQRHGGGVASDTGGVSPATPTKNTETKPTLTKVNDAATPSVTSLEKKKRSVFKGKAKFSDSQADCLEWLKSLEIDTGDDTLSWWARNYTMPRLEEVYREAISRKPDSIGAYMHSLLQKKASVIAGRIGVNALYATEFKEFKSWNNLEIHQKYAIIRQGNIEIEIDFNMDPIEFQNYLHNKYDDNNHDLR